MRPLPGQAQSHPRRGRRACALGLCLALLGGCGGGDSEVWWCVSSGSGSVSAGFNTSACPPQAQAD